MNNASFWDKVVKTIKKIDKGGSSDPSNSGSDESIKSLKDKAVNFYTEVVESVEKSAVGSDKSGTPPAEGGNGTQGYGNGKDPNNAATEKGKSQGNAIDHSDDGQGALEKYYHQKGETGVPQNGSEIHHVDNVEVLKVKVEGESFVRSDGGIETPFVSEYDTVCPPGTRDSLVGATGDSFFRKKNK